MIKQHTVEKITASPEFARVMQKKSRVLWILTSLSLTYYFALVLGAAYCRPFFASLLTGHINFGMVFALSQYGFAGVIAFIYVHYMKQIDADMKSILTANSN